MSMSMYVSISMAVYMSLSMYTHTHTYKCVCVRVYVSVHVYVCVHIQGVALIGAVALNSVDFATVASNSAVFIHQSNHPRYFFVVFCCVK